MYKNVRDHSPQGPCIESGFFAPSMDGKPPPRMWISRDVPSAEKEESCVEETRDDDVQPEDPIMQRETLHNIFWTNPAPVLRVLRDQLRSGV